MDAGAEFCRLAQWMLTYARLRLPTWPASVHRVTMIAFLTVAIRSFVVGVHHDATWRRTSHGPSTNALDRSKVTHP